MPKAKVDFLQHHELMKDEMMLAVMVTFNSKSIYGKFSQYVEIDALIEGLRHLADDIEGLK